MRLTIAIGAVAALSFAATFALAPYADTLSERLDFERFLTVQAKQPVAVTQEHDCSAPFGKVLAALAAKPCE